MSRKEYMEQVLFKELAPSYLNVENESAKHHVPPGSETHFKITVVSSQFIGIKPIDRHKLLNQLFKVEFSQGLHALSMHLFTDDEWEKKKATVLKSPPCRDGYKHS